MSHVRQQIRSAVAALIDNLATTADRAYVGRQYSIEADELPCLLIYTTTEQVSALTLSYPRKLDRVLSVVVEGVTDDFSLAGESSLLNQLDTIGAEVEAAIAADPDLGGLAKDTQLAGVDTGLRAIGERPVGYIRMTFNCVYHTRETTPETAET